MISLILIFFVGVCMAVMDVVSNYHFQKSIFYLFPKKYQRWWDNNPTNGSWMNKYKFRDMRYGRRKIALCRGIGKAYKINYPVQFTDAWHFFKMLAIIIMCLSVVFYSAVLPHFLLDFLLLGVSWNIGFVLCYSHLFRLNFYKNSNHKN